MSVNSILVFVLVITLHGLSFGKTTAEKLELKLGKYEETQTWLKSQFRVSESDLEKKLSLVPDMELNNEDQDNIQEMHRLRIEESKKKAVQDSIISFDQIREDKKTVEQFCAAVPKGGNLHLHPTGSWSPEFFQSLLDELGRGYSVTQFQMPKEGGTFLDFDRLFRPIREVVGRMQLDDPRTKRW